MAKLSKITSPTAIRKAMVEYDRIGQDSFLEKYGFGKAYRFRLKYGENRYDSKAILGVAYGIQHPKEGPLTAADFSGGERTVTRRLDSLGFDIVVVQDGGEEIPLREYTAQKMVTALEREAHEAERSGQFDPTSIEDARKRIRAGIILRQGQRSFRTALMKAYNGRCAMSECDCPEALEAAHIHPYRGEETNHVVNGLLLRADLHILFDLGQISVSLKDYKIIVSDTLRKTVYGKLHGAPLKLPKDPALRPNVEVLKKHRLIAGL
jgi:hypothetical protein